MTIRIATLWSDLWIIPALLVPMAAISVLLALKLDPAFAASFRRWRQRHVLRRLKRRLPAQIAQERRRLYAAWDKNPAAQCATIFNRFRNPSKKVAMTQLADDVDAAIGLGCSLFETDFLGRYGDRLDSLLEVQTAEMAKSLAAQQPTNAAYVIHKLAQNDEQLLQGFDAAIRQALAEGRRDFGIIQAHLEQLRENAPRFRRILTPGFFSQIGNMIIGALTGAALGAIGIDSDFLIQKSAQFTAGTWSDWRGKANEEFGNKFCEAMEEVPIVCENMDAAVRRSLTVALDNYLEHRLRHQNTTLGALLDLSLAGWDVGHSISYFQDSQTRAKR
jgi:hypothetical protein